VASQLRATCRPQRRPSAQKSVPSSPVYSRRVPVSTSCRTNVSRTWGFFPYAHAPPSASLADRLALMAGTEVELTRRLALDFGRLQATLCRG
jgi:hypothetical protein